MDSQGFKKLFKMSCGGEAACGWVGDVTRADSFSRTAMDAGNCPSGTWCILRGLGAWDSTGALFLLCECPPPPAGIEYLQTILFIYLFESLVVSKDVLVRGCVISTL